MVASHQELLIIANRLRRAVVVDDLGLLHDELLRLREAFVAHVEAERPELEVRHAVAVDVVIRGQQRIVELLTATIDGLGDDDAACTCVVRVAEIERALRRQAAMEAARPVGSRPVHG